MKGFKSQRKIRGNLDDAVLALLKISVDTVHDASQILVKNLDAKELNQLPKVQNELILFFDFSLDYWIQITVPSPKEQHIVREALSSHWLESAGGGDESQAMLDILQNRFNSYGQIVNKEKNDAATFFSLGKKLSEFCDMPGHPNILLLAPHLFTVAMESVSVILGYRGEKKI